MLKKEVSSEKVALVFALKLIAYELLAKSKRKPTAAELRHAELVRRARRAV